MYCNVGEWMILPETGNEQLATQLASCSGAKTFKSNKLWYICIYLDIENLQKTYKA